MRFAISVKFDSTRGKSGAEGCLCTDQAYDVSVELWHRVGPQKPCMKKRPAQATKNICTINIRSRPVGVEALQIVHPSRHRDRNKATRRMTMMTRSPQWFACPWSQVMSPCTPASWQKMICGTASPRPWHCRSRETFPVDTTRLRPPMAPYYGQHVVAQRCRSFRPEATIYQSDQLLAKVYFGTEKQAKSAKSSCLLQPCLFRVSAWSSSGCSNGWLNHRLWIKLNWVVISFGLLSFLFVFDLIHAHCPPKKNISP